MRQNFCTCFVMMMEQQQKNRNHSKLTLFYLSGHGLVYMSMICLKIVGKALGRGLGVWMLMCFNMSEW